VKISVVTVVYNREDTLSDAMQSLNVQSLPNKEHLIIDGASTDDTLSVARRYRRRHTRIFSAPDRGIYDALNKGLWLAKGEVVGILHSDDMFADPEVLSDVERAFADPDTDAVYGNLTYVARDNPDRIIRTWRSGPFDPRALRAGWMPPHPTVFLRRRVIEQMDFYDTSYRIAADYDAMLRVFGQNGFRAVHIPRVLVKMRVGGASNGSLGRILQKSREDFRALRRNGVSPATSALLMKNVSKLPQFFDRGAA